MKKNGVKIRDFQSMNVVEIEWKPKSASATQTHRHRGSCALMCVTHMQTDTHHTEIHTKNNK